jgi:hypothetical protein
LAARAICIASKNSDKRTIENAKNPAQPTLCSSHRPGQGVARLWRPRIFQNFDEQSVANGRNPAQSSICGFPTGLAPEQPEKQKIERAK